MKVFSLQHVPVPRAELRISHHLKCASRPRPPQVPAPRLQGPCSDPETTFWEQVPCSCRAGVWRAEPWNPLSCDSEDENRVHVPLLQEWVLDLEFGNFPATTVSVTPQHPGSGGRHTMPWEAWHVPGPALRWDTQMPPVLLTGRQPLQRAGGLGLSGRGRDSVPMGPH